MKKRKSNIPLILIFLVGVSLLLYPSVANWWNTKVFNEEIAYFTTVVSSVENSRLDEIIASAQEYNAQHSLRGNSFSRLKGEELEEYNSRLSIDGSSMMGYLNIPRINSYLPIYHTTEEDVLASGIGHIEGTSLPIGGESSHCVLSGHRGLPSARLLTDLDQLIVGDTFLMDIFGLTLTYEVDQILTVLPEELSALRIEQGQDLCTLVTCTPYGVNSHRLLVRGHRVANANGELRVMADALQIRPVAVAPFVAAPILLVLLVMMLVDTGNKKRISYPEKGAEDDEI